MKTKIRQVTKEQLNSQNKKKIMSEAETIESILKLAREQGVEEKVKNLIEKFQNAVKGARTEEERRQIGTLGLAEIYRTIGCVGGLVVNGNQILPPDPSYQDAINTQKSVVKLD